MKNYVNKNNFVTPTSVSSNMPNNQLRIKNEKYEVGSGTLEHNYYTSSNKPHTFYANTSLISPTKSLNDKFRFPNKDNPLSEAAKLEIPKIQSLEYIINIFVGRLDLDLKNEWDILAGRDTSI